MSTLIVCPNCKTQFEPEAAIAQSVEERVRKEFNQRWVEMKKTKDDEVKQLETKFEADRLELQKQLDTRLRDERKEMETRLRDEMQARVKGDYETQLRLLEETNLQNEKRLQEARNKELDFLKKEQELENKAREIDLQIQRRLTEERNRIADSIRKEEEERSKMRDLENELKLKERDKQLEDQKRMIEEMKRKAEQGSMQLQGEIQELALEELLRSAFPFDIVNEVGKGKRGADCILTVRNKFGQECGRIIFESKRTKDFGKDWIEKLKADMRAQTIEIGVIVTQAMPDGMETFGMKDEIWICTFPDVAAVVSILRELLIRLAASEKSQENKGEKMTMLYNYLTSSEFAQQWKAISEGFATMRSSIQRERDQMEKLWKAREKQLEKVLLNAAHIRGSIEGIAGLDVDLTLTEPDNNYLLE